jgi:capsular polysaccharide transport system permease protein
MRSKMTYAPLFIIPAISAEVVCFSVALLEIGNAFVIYGVLVLGNWIFFGPLEIDNFALIASGLVLASVLGSAFAYMFVSVIPNVQFGLRAMQILIRPLFYTSGVFFLASELPLVLQDILWWNPILHAVEITRTGAFGDYGSRVAEALVPIVAIIAFLAIGVATSGRGGLFDVDDHDGYAL